MNSSSRSALRSQLKRLMKSLAERAKRILRSSLPSSRQRLLASISGFFGGESKPVTPSWTKSRMPPLSVATIAQPQAAPSAGGRAKPSVTLELRTILEPLYNSSTIHFCDGFRAYVIHLGIHDERRLLPNKTTRRSGNLFFAISSAAIPSFEPLNATGEHIIATWRGRVAIGWVTP